jgi:hypothetical protein
MPSQNFKHLFHLDPAPDGAAGGAAAAGSPAGGDAAPAFDASQYVPKAEFEQIRNDYSEFRQTAEQRFQDYDSRLPKPAKEEAKSDVAPKAADYDFNKEGEFERFMDDRARFNFKQEFSTREKTYQESQREQGYKQYVQTAQNEHSARQDAYKVLNPDYDERKNIDIRNEAVVLSILESEFSANIHHFLQKNAEKTAELRKLAVNNPAAAIRMVGRLESQFESQAAAVPAKKAAASAAPTSAGFGGGKPSGSPKKSNEEIFDKWQ